MSRPPLQSNCRTPHVRLGVGGNILRSVLVALLLAGAACSWSTARASDQYEYDAAGRLFRVTHHTGRVTTYSYDGNGNLLSTTVTLLPTDVAVGDSPGVAFALGRAYPNPGQSPAFTFSLPRKAPVEVRVFGISGRLVATVVDGTFDPGTHRVQLSPGRWAAGVYYYRLDTSGFSKVRKFVLLK